MLTKEQIMEMKPGPTLNVLIAVQIFGWIPWSDQRGEYTYVIWQRPGDREPYTRSQRWESEMQRYSQITVNEIDHMKHIVAGLKDYLGEISPAWEVVEKMRARGFDFALESLHDSLNAGGDVYHARFMRRQEGSYGEYDSTVSVADALCKAALLALIEVKEREG